MLDPAIDVHGLRKAYRSTVALDALTGHQLVSGRDVGLPDGAHDDTYLAELARALPAVMAHAPRCVFYLAGADPYEDDQLGGLRLTKEGLRRRDRMVVDAVGRAGIPLVVTLAGGYARRVEDTVAIHAATIEEVARYPGSAIPGSVRL